LKASAAVLEQILSTENRKYVVEHGLEIVINMTLSLKDNHEFAKITTGILEKKYVSRLNKTLEAQWDISNIRQAQFPLFQSLHLEMGQRSTMEAFKQVESSSSSSSSSKKAFSSHGLEQSENYEMIFDSLVLNLSNIAKKYVSRLNKTLEAQ
jgi:hypothetical protein